MRRRVLQRSAASHIGAIYCLHVSKNRMPGLCRLLNAATSGCGARGVQEAFKRRRSVLSKTRQLKSMSYVWPRQRKIVEPTKFELGWLQSWNQYTL